MLHRVLNLLYTIIECAKDEKCKGFHPLSFLNFISQFHTFSFVCYIYLKYLPEVNFIYYLFISNFKSNLSGKKNRKKIGLSIRIDMATHVCYKYILYTTVYICNLGNTETIGVGGYINKYFSSIQK